jgi:hypothetical protein
VILHWFSTFGYPEDGSTAVEKQRPSLPMSVGITTSFRVIGDIPVTAATTLGDVRRIIDTNPEFEAYLPPKCASACCFSATLLRCVSRVGAARRYMIVSAQFNRPVPEPYEGRYIATSMCFVVLAQNAETRILTEIPGAVQIAKPVVKPSPKK